MNPSERRIISLKAQLRRHKRKLSRMMLGPLKRPKGVLLPKARRADRAPGFGQQTTTTIVQPRLWDTTPGAYAAPPTGRVRPR